MRGKDSEIEGAHTMSEKDKWIASDIKFILKIRIGNALLKTDAISVRQNKPIYAIRTHAFFMCCCFFICCATKAQSMRVLHCIKLSLQLYHIDKVNGNVSPKKNSTTKPHSIFSKRFKLQVNEQCSDAPR